MYFFKISLDGIAEIETEIIIKPHENRSLHN